MKTIKAIWKWFKAKIWHGSKDTKILVYGVVLVIGAFFMWVSERIVDIPLAMFGTALTMWACIELWHLKQRYGE